MGDESADVYVIHTAGEVYFFVKWLVYLGFICGALYMALYCYVL
jgi:hypothetical protein